MVAVSGELIHRQLAVRDLALRLRDGVAATRVIGEASSLHLDFPIGLAAVSQDARIVAGSLPAEVTRSKALRDTLATRPVEALLRPLGGSEPILLAIFPCTPLSVVGAFSISNLLRVALPGLETPPAPASAVIVDRESGLLAHIGAPQL